MVSLLSLDPARYVASALHSPERIFRETNCYVDVWIELLHALTIQPASAMSFACFTDFESDQWTFFKPPPECLRKLYGIDVHEMQFFRPATEHIAECLADGRTLIMEADSYYLPDTAGTAYRRLHVKSSIAMEAIDIAESRLRYFHNAGYYELTGEDYYGVFRLGRAFPEDVLPPYVELVRFDSGSRLEGEELRQEALAGLRSQMTWKPARNPWQAFTERLARDLPSLLAGSEDRYHAYAFATVRQCGAAFELAKTFIEWLNPEPLRARQIAIEAFGRQAEGAKALLFKLARRKPFDIRPFIDGLAEAWYVAMQALQEVTNESASFTSISIQSGSQQAAAH